MAELHINVGLQALARGYITLEAFADGMAALAKRDVSVRELWLERMNEAQLATVLASIHTNVAPEKPKVEDTLLLGTPGTFLAITDDIDRVNVDREWRLAHGDMLVLVTDGVTEAESAAGKPFGYEGTLEVIEARTRAPVAEIRDALFAALARHSPTLADDATILVLRYVGTQRGPA